MRLNYFIQHYHRQLFYTSWLLFHIIQAYNTELFDDEAYYWVYSRHLAWGYFDHPPVIAMLIAAGYAIFKNELGVRIFSILLSTGSLAIIESLIERKKAMLFYAIAASLALAQLGGMIAVPDAPLMFFIALFFLLYRRFLNNMSLFNTLALGLVIALMFYTKYHAVLVVVLTGMSNLNLLRHWQTYTACLFALLLFIPHLYWQHLHGYPSLQFHLFERSAAEYLPWYTIEFLIGQVLLAGPFMGWLLIIAAFLYKPESLTEKALKYSFVGIYAFFLISTLKGKTEANWTIPAFIGLIVLSHQYLFDNRRLRELLYKALPLTLVAVILGRTVMLVDLPPAWWIFKDEVHENKIFVQQVRSRAGNRPVVFLDTYQKPSKYWFYSGNTALGLNTPTYRRNNFNFWPLEDQYIGNPAHVFGMYDSSFFSNVFVLRNGDTNGGRLVPLYFSFSRIRIDGIIVHGIGRNKISVRFTTTTPPAYLHYFNKQPYDTATIYLALYKHNRVLKYVSSSLTVSDIKGVLQQHLVMLDLPMPAGNYKCKFAVSTCLPGRPSLNSAGFMVKIN